MLILLVVSCVLANAQSETPGISEPEAHDLVQSSDFVVVGKLTGRRTVSRRLTKQELRELNDLGQTIGGSIFKLNVARLLCASNSSGQKANSSKKPTEFLLFESFEKTNAGETARPSYIDEHFYLAFLSVIPNQKDLAKRLKLPDGIYYEPTGGMKGLILINKPETKEVKITEKACRKLQKTQRISEKR